MQARPWDASYCCFACVLAWLKGDEGPSHLGSYIEFDVAMQADSLVVITCSPNDVIFFRPVSIMS